MLAALAGTNLIYGLGMIESGVTFDYAQLVMDDEFARMIKQVVGGIRVDDETLAVDDIAAVGSFGDFLSLDATMRHMREASQPVLIDRRVREDWEARGRDRHATSGRSRRRADILADAPAGAAARRRAAADPRASWTTPTESWPASDRERRRSQPPRREVASRASGSQARRRLVTVTSQRWPPMTLA